MSQLERIVGVSILTVLILAVSVTFFDNLYADLAAVIGEITKVLVN